MDRRGFIKLVALTPLAGVFSPVNTVPSYRVKCHAISDDVPFEFFFEGRKYAIKNNNVCYLPKKVVEHLRSLTYYSTRFCKRLSLANDCRFEITRIT